ncbi:hypothetical protein QAD02_019396 [Eretmocerus hayati]|uniref:Uncharacterized protein n=1 Tax=Eretmocerus hayati TaxID=131215 RepID=A0ACC2PJ56_9HYME|nr:hypothetical protein QAD02_019396 [Eretmocerus hayati]
MDKESPQSPPQGGSPDVAKILLEKGIRVNNASLDGRIALKIALELKDADMVMRLMGNNVKSNVELLQRYPLHVAVEGIQPEIVECLLPIYGNNEMACSALKLAFERGNEVMVRTFLDTDVDFASKFLKPVSLIHRVCEHGWLDVLKILLNRGIDPHVVTSQKKSLLHVAAEQKNVEMTKILLAHGVNVNAKQMPNNSTPLHVAAQNDCIEVVRELLLGGATVDIKIYPMGTALHIAFENNNLELANFLMDHGANLLLTKYGKNPLEQAIDYGWTEVARRLLNAGADPCTSGVEGYSLLHVAVRRSYVDVVRLLLEHGADPNEHGNRLKESALQLAARSRCREAAELLLDSGAEIDYGYESGNSALHISIEKSNEPLALMLLMRGAKLLREDLGIVRNHLLSAVSLGWCDVTRLLLDSGVPVDGSSSLVDNKTPLQKAIETRNIKMAEMLILRGADVQKKVNGVGMLNLAASTHCPDMVRLLLEHGIDINQRCDEKDTNALFNALTSRDDETAMLLLERGIDCSVCDCKLRRTALHYAAEFGCLKMIREFCQRRGINPNVRDIEGVSPLMLAVQTGGLQTVELLIEHGARVNSHSNPPPYTALQHAMDMHDMPMMKLLLRAGAHLHQPHVRTHLTGFSTALKRLSANELHQVLLEHRPCGRDEREGLKEMERRLPGFMIQQIDIGLVLVKHLAAKGFRPTPHPRLNYESFEPCFEEIERMKHFRFYENFTMYQVLTESYAELSIAVRNDDLQQAFYNSNYTTEFPRYSSSLSYRVNRAGELKQLQQAAECTLRLALKGLPHVVLWQILKHLPDSTLKILHDMFDEFHEALEDNLLLECDISGEQNAEQL